MFPYHGGGKPNAVRLARWVCSAQHFPWNVTSFHDKSKLECNYSYLPLSSWLGRWQDENAWRWRQQSCKYLSPPLPITIDGRRKPWESPVSSKTAACGEWFLFIYLRISFYRSSGFQQEPSSDSQRPLIFQIDLLKSTWWPCFLNHFRRTSLIPICMIRSPNLIFSPFSFRIRSYFIRIYDVTKSQKVWEQELYNGFNYVANMKPFFHFFEADEGFAGLNFASEQEANKFKG